MKTKKLKKRTVFTFKNLTPFNTSTEDTTLTSITTTVSGFSQ